jgi:hypothetical protein
LLGPVETFPKNLLRYFGTASDQSRVGEPGAKTERAFFPDYAAGIFFTTDAILVHQLTIWLSVSRTTPTIVTLVMNNFWTPFFVAMSAHNESADQSCQPTGDSIACNGSLVSLQPSLSFL